MRRLAIVAAISVAVACQSGKVQKPRDATYAVDVERICYVEQLSGALEQEEGARSTMVAMWLANNLVTQDARDLMVRQAKLGPADKAALLRAEAREAGLSDCPTADAWAPK